MTWPGGDVDHMNLGMAHQMSSKDHRHRLIFRGDDILFEQNSIQLVLINLHSWRPLVLRLQSTDGVTDLVNSGSGKVAARSVKGTRRTKQFTGGRHGITHLVEQTSLLQTLVMGLPRPHLHCAVTQVEILHLLVRVRFSQHKFGRGHVFFDVCCRQCQHGPQSLEAIPFRIFQ